MGGEEKRLTRDQRRLLGVAIAMAHADGVVENSERELIATLTRDLELDSEAKDEVARMMSAPPGAAEIAAWCVTERDRLDIYAIALSMARADGQVVDEEAALLRQLATLLELSETDVERATALVRELVS